MYVYINISPFHKNVLWCSRDGKCDAFINKGGIDELIGPYRAGKSTTIKPLLQYLHVTSKEADVCELDPSKQAGKIISNGEFNYFAILSKVVTVGICIAIGLWKYKSKDIVV